MNGNPNVDFIIKDNDYSFSVQKTYINFFVNQLLL